MGEENECFHEGDRPLLAIADAFEELACSLRPGSEHLRLDEFCAACSLVSVLFNCLGLAFKFAEMEYGHKVHELAEASKSYDTLTRILDHDVAQDTVKRQVRQGLDLIRALFEQFLSSDSLPLSEAASTAYAEVCAPYHSWAIRKAVFFGMYALAASDQSRPHRLPFPFPPSLPHRRRASPSTSFSAVHHARSSILRSVWTVGYKFKEGFI